MTNRRGFALLAVLWVVVALAALAAGAVERARAEASVTGDRVARMRARWAAEGCLALAQERIEAALISAGTLQAPSADTLYFANGARCVAEVYDTGARLNIDSAAPAMKAGLDDSLLTPYGDGRLNVNAAPPAVLATLPGFGAETLRVIADERAWRRPFTGLEDLTRRLSPPARAALLAHYGELSALTAFRTTALVVTARGWVAGTRSTLSIQTLIVNGGNRAALVRRRMW
jgi:type II secretory pathway component PulK